ncbi:F-box/FBD/LRR-repeat protein At1g13570-like [Rutidosis leptorrhynchoides]|uniref:F-box/FBD/LRR-repeat protein At1g13570-like n=1 Tax=Rutidosis leptorrhynchoides TaxID=125765 RepID=UPI003A998CB9
MKPKRSSLDIISGLPQNILETILCLVPIRDAVRSSILSKKWRYNWNKIPKLVFNEEDMFNKSKEKHRGEEDEENDEEDDEENTQNEVLTGKYKFFYAIHQVLLMHQGFHKLSEYCKLMQVLSDSYMSSRTFVCELFGYIPAIEHLHLAIQYFHRYEFKSSLLELPSPLVCLKYVHLLDGCFTGQYGLPFIVFLIRSSPNLEKLKLQSFHYHGEKSGIDSLTEKEYSDIWLEHLKELELFIANDIPELEFLKLILARSPMLKEVIIIINYVIDKDAELEMLRVLSDTPRASDVVEIIVERLDDPESPDALALISVAVNPIDVVPSVLSFP